MKNFRKLKLGTMKYVTLEDINDYESNTVVNSPKSIEACFREGIQPRDLLYIPEDEFQNSQFPDDIKVLHFQYFEAKRKELLANVRKIRKNIIIEQEANTRSSTALNASFTNQKKEAERFKAVVAKAICDRCDREEEVKKSLIVNEVERQLSADKVAEFNETQARLVKTRNDKKNALLKERSKKVEIEQQFLEEKKKAYEEKNLKELHRLIDIQDERIREIQQKKIAHEEKTKKYYEKMMDKDLKIQALRKLNYEESDLQVKARREILIQKKLKRKNELRQKWNAKLKKTGELRRKAEEEISLRQIEYYKLKKISDKKYEEFGLIHEQPKEITHPKVIQVAELIETEQTFKKNRLAKKMSESEYRIERIRDEEQRKIEHKKHINILKTIKRDWNINRIKNRKDYLKELSYLKKQQKFQKIDEMARSKSQMLKNHSIQEMREVDKNTKLKEAMFKMSLTKVWSKEELLKIIKYTKQIKKYDNDL